LAGFFVVPALGEVDEAALGVESVEVCPAENSTTRKKARAQAIRRIEVGEVINLMHSL
jgi:hypothetical protein